MAMIDVTDLADWIEGGIPADRVDFAEVNVAAAALIVAETAGHPEWNDLTPAPSRVRLIAIQLAKRSFLNPTAVVRSNVGPLGESIVEEYARTLELTDAEEAYLLGLTPGGAGGGTGGGSLFVVNMGGAPSVMEHTIYTPDMSGGLFPMYAAGEIGSP